MMRRRLARIVQAKSFSNMDIEGVTELLTVIDFIDTKLEAYKKRYLKLKQKALNDIERKKSKLLQSAVKATKEEAVEEKPKAKKQKKMKVVVEEPQSFDLLDLGISS